jgi:hypothetical protein
MSSAGEGVREARGCLHARTCKTRERRSERRPPTASALRAKASELRSRPSGRTEEEPPPWERTAAEEW